ncbi:MAG: response regulator [Sphingomonadaceae bacterium]
MLELLSEMVQELGPHQVTGETDARRGLAQLATLALDLLICDLSMPGMDGIEFLRHAAARQFRGSVLLLSGVDSSVLRAAERLATAQGLLLVGACPKPLAAAQLAEMLQRVTAPPTPI